MGHPPHRPSAPTGCWSTTDSTPGTSSPTTRPTTAPHGRTSPSICEPPPTTPQSYRSPPSAFSAATSSADSSTSTTTPPDGDPGGATKAQTRACVGLLAPHRDVPPGNALAEVVGETISAGATRSGMVNHPAAPPPARALAQGREGKASSLMARVVRAIDRSPDVGSGAPVERSVDHDQPVLPGELRCLDSLSPTDKSR